MVYHCNKCIINVFNAPQSRTQEEEEGGSSARDNDEGAPEEEAQKAGESCTGTDPHRRLYYPGQVF